MEKGTNAPTKPQFEGQIVKFDSPHASGVILYDVAKVNKYGKLEWWAINEPTELQKAEAEWSIVYR